MVCLAFKLLGKLFEKARIVLPRAKQSIEISAYSNVTLTGHPPVLENSAS